MTQQNAPDVKAGRDDRICTGEWIWYPEGRTLSNTFMYFRRRISVKREMRSAAIHVSADSRYQLYLNGTLVGRGPAVQDPGHPVFDTYDLSGRLREGENVVAALVYCYAVPTNTYVTSASPGKTGGFLCDLEIRLDDSRFTVGTDGTWRVARSNAYPYRSERLSRWRSLVEVFDARAEPEGWTEMEFDDSNWRNAVPVERLTSIRSTDTGALRSRPLASLKEEDVSVSEVFDRFRVAWNADPVAYLLNGDRAEPELEVLADSSARAGSEENPRSLRSGPVEFPVRIEHPDGLGGVFGLSKYTAGRVSVSVDASEATEITIVLHERKPDSLSHALRPTHGNWVRFICAEGSRTYTSIEVFACRYIAVVVDSARSVRIDKIGMLQQSYPLESEGRFESSDPSLDALFAASKATLIPCMHDIITDNTWREFQNWSGDIEHAKLTMYRCFGAYPLGRRSLSLIGQGVTDSGRVISAWPSSVPSFRGMEQHFIGEDRSFGPELPAHGMQWVSSLWQYYLHSGDISLLYETRPAVRRAVRWFRSHLGSDGLLSLDLWDFAWHHVDHTGPVYPPVIATNLVYCACLIDASSIASATGEDGESDELLAEAHQLADAIHAASWDPRLSVHADIPSTDSSRGHVSEHVISLALLLGLVPDEHHEHAVGLLISEDLDVGRGTPTFRNYIHWALTSAGRSDLVLSELSSLWSAQSSLSETGTFAEFFDHELKRRGGGPSNCQSASALPAYAISSILLGVRPTKPGFEEFVVAPTLGRLSFARGTVPTPRGFIQIECRAERDDSPSVSVEAPDGTSWHRGTEQDEGVPYAEFRAARKRRSGS